MGRPRRVHYDGAFYHAIVRGNNRRLIFERSQDLEKFEELIADGIDRFGHRIHAYCWMNNHAHLAVEVDREPLSKIVHNLTSRYSSWFNHRYSRTGHLFERRYRAGLVESEASVCRLIRYIHLNPVRAGLTREPQDYPWSSHAGYLDPDRKKSWLETRRILALFGDTPVRARLDLERFVKEGALDQEDSRQLCTLDELIVDDNQFEGSEKSELLVGDSSAEGAALGRLVELEDLIEIVTGLTGVSEEEIRGRSQRKPIARARALLAILAKEDKWMTLSELGRHLARHSSTLGRVADRLSGVASKNDQVRLLLFQARQRHARLNKSGKVDRGPD